MGFAEKETECEMEKVAQAVQIRQCASIYIRLCINFTNITNWCILIL
jgi:hypothetical protein